MHFHKRLKVWQLVQEGLLHGKTVDHQCPMFISVLCYTHSGSKKSAFIT